MYEVLSTKQFRKWLHGLRDAKGKMIITSRLTRLQKGNFGDCRNVGDGVFELRIFVGPGYRVYCARQGDQILLLLIGGDKSTQDKDIATAKELKKIWEGEG